MKKKGKRMWKGEPLHVCGEDGSFHRRDEVEAESKNVLKAKKKSQG